jgi:hypothetical protein
MRNHWVGLMLVADFLDEFIPIHQGDPPGLPDLFSTLFEIKIKNKLYDPFVRITLMALLCIVLANLFCDRLNSYLKITTAFLASGWSTRRTILTLTLEEEKRSGQIPLCTKTVWTLPKT